MGGIDGLFTRMNSSMIISVDAMGGDEGPEMVIPGLDLLLVRQPALTFLLFGEEDKVHQSLQIIQKSEPQVKFAIVM